MTTIAHPDGRPWRYWLREDGGWWVVVPDEPMPHVLGRVETATPYGYRATAWQDEASYWARTMHLAAEQLHVWHAPQPEPQQAPVAGPPLPDALEVF